MKNAFISLALVLSMASSAAEASCKLGKGCFLIATLRPDEREIEIAPPIVAQRLEPHVLTLRRGLCNHRPSAGDDDDTLRVCLDVAAGSTLEVVGVGVSTLFSPVELPLEIAWVQPPELSFYPQTKAESLTHTARIFPADETSYLMIGDVVLIDDGVTGRVGIFVRKGRNPIVLTRKTPQ